MSSTYLRPLSMQCVPQQVHQEMQYYKRVLSGKEESVRNLQGKRGWSSMSMRLKPGGSGDGGKSNGGSSSNGNNSDGAAVTTNTEIVPRGPRVGTSREESVGPEVMSFGAKRNGGSNSRMTNKTTIVVSTADDDRMTVPPMELRVWEAESALIRVCELGVKPMNDEVAVPVPPVVVAKAVDIDPEEPVVYAPARVWSPDRWTSFWSGRKKWLRCMLDDPVMAEG